MMRAMAAKAILRPAPYTSHITINNLKGRQSTDNTARITPKILHLEQMYIQKYNASSNCLYVQSLIKTSLKKTVDREATETKPL